MMTLASKEGLPSLLVARFAHKVRCESHPIVSLEVDLGEHPVRE